MSMASTLDESKKAIFLRPLIQEDSLEVYSLSVSNFPMPDSEMAAVGNFLRKLLNVVVTEWAHKLEVFLQYNQLYRGDGTARFTRNALQWRPKMGLGVWPDREPPRYYKREDFEELMPGESLNPMLYKVFRVTAAGARQPACEAMLGLGTVLAVAIPPDGGSVLNNAKRILGQSIEPGSIPSFPFYIPLLECKSLKSADTQGIKTWLCGSSLYVRESVEDQAILIAASQSVLPILKTMDASYQSGPDVRWRIAV